MDTLGDQHKNEGTVVKANRLYSDWVHKVFKGGFHRYFFNSYRTDADSVCLSKSDTAAALAWSFCPPCLQKSLGVNSSIEMS